MLYNGSVGVKSLGKYTELNEYYGKKYSSGTYSSQLRNNNYEYASNPDIRVIRHIQKKKYKQKKSVSFSAFVLVLVCAVFFAICVFPFLVRNFIKPVVLSSSSSALRVGYEIIAPTSKYLHNNIFLGKKSLIGASVSNPAMVEMTMTSPMLKLQADLIALAREYSTVHPSIFVWDYETGKYASVNSDEIFPAASIIKIPVLLEFFRSVEAGQVNIEDKMTLTDYYRAEGSGDIQFQREGNKYSMDFLAKKMIQISDNSSTNMLMSSIGGINDVNRAIKSWGLKRTEINNWLPDMGGTNVTTTEDLARMLYNIENSSFLSSSSKEKIFEYMGGVKNNRLIHSGLSPKASFYHKTGDIGYMLGDAGIVITPDKHKYIVAIMARRPYNSPAGKEFIVRASEIIYNTISTRNF